MSRIHPLVRLVLGMVLVMGIAGCASTPPAAPEQPTLYQRLGGREAIKGVVDDFVANLAADPRVNSRFKGLDAGKVAKIQTDLADQICDASGGPAPTLAAT